MFYLGAFIVSWQRKTNVPLFVSHNRLKRIKNLQPATGNWCLDSGGFTELSNYGHWRTSAKTYCQAVQRYSKEIGKLDWAAPQDYMCEPNVLYKTGLTVKQHQQKTINNFLDLKNLAPELPFVPVLQGWTNSDYLEMVEMYERAGVDLRKYKTVGVGSVCRRQATSEIYELIKTLASLKFPLHGFGVKTSGLVNYGKFLKSADSMAWSYHARIKQLRLETCTHQAAHCNNCINWALVWRKNLLTKSGFNA